MIKCDEFADACLERGFDFFTGVPDSTFKSWMSYLERDKSPLKNVTTVNEAEGIAVASGYHLSTGDSAVVYMQNDGFGKCVNPLSSLANKEVYSIPMLLMIGWRSEPGTDDAQHHDKMGEILLDLLELLDVEYQELPEDMEEAESVLDDAQEYLESEGLPYAIIVRQDTFEPDTRENVGGPGEMSREAAVETAADQLSGEELVLSTTGKLSRELYEYRKRTGDGLETDFYNVGAMGCVQSIGLGVTCGRPNRDIVVFDGDGSVLMQMGALATIGHEVPQPFHHFIFDNGAHDSTGGQATASSTVDFATIAEACGYTSTRTVSSREGIEEAVNDDLQQQGPTLTVVEIARGARSDLGRPTESFSELKAEFMANAIKGD